MLLLQGCYEPMRDLFNEYALILAVTATCILVIELVGILAACCQL